MFSFFILGHIKKTFNGSNESSKCRTFVNLLLDCFACKYHHIISIAMQSLLCVKQQTKRNALSVFLSSLTAESNALLLPADVAASPVSYESSLLKAAKIIE